MTFVLRNVSPVQVQEFLGRDLACDAQNLVEALADRGLTLSFAESLTGGKLADTIVGVPGASAAFKGSAVTYATESKHDVLGVDEALLKLHGAVDATVAAQMSQGVRELWKSDFGASATGVAGPTEQDGKPVGLVYVAVSRAAHPTYVFEINFAHRNLSDCFGRLNMQSQREFIRIGAVKVLYGLLVTEFVRGPSSLG